MPADQPEPEPELKIFKAVYETTNHDTVYLYAKDQAEAESVEEGEMNGMDDDSMISESEYVDHHLIALEEVNTEEEFKYRDKLPNMIMNWGKYVPSHECGEGWPPVTTIDHATGTIIHTYGCGAVWTNKEGWVKGHA